MDSYGDWFTKISLLHYDIYCHHSRLSFPLREINYKPSYLGAGSVVLWVFVGLAFVRFFFFLRAHHISTEKSKVSESVKIDGIQKNKRNLYHR